MESRFLRALALATFVALPSPATAVFPPLSDNTAIEYFHAGFDHYFITSLPSEIAALDSGQLTGWTRTGRAFSVYAAGTPAHPAWPVCRFYIPPQHGDSHFFTASQGECAEVRAKSFTDPNYSGYVQESPTAFYVDLPSFTTGACPAGTVPVYRLWNLRADSNHRYTTDAGIKSVMVGKGYIAEGYGPDAAAMCTPLAVLVDALTRASGLSSFAPACEGVPLPPIPAFVNTETEPYIAVNPADANNMIGVWQQDRWFNGGSRGLGAAYSMDGGGTWTRVTIPTSRCTGGNAGNGADFERATDPWVTFGPDGTAWQIAVAFNSEANGDNAVLVNRSTDGGRTWSAPVALRRDGAQAFNDKESITADPTDPRYVYATWDRLSGNNGPTWFARTREAGATWEAARNIYDPGATAQTINNQIVVLPDGALVLFFTELATTGAANPRLRIMRSIDKGASWEAPITIADHRSIGTVDPDTGTGIRDGATLGSIAAGRNGTLVAAWQDSRFARGSHDDIAFSRSTDGGLTWSAPLRINGDPSASAFLPAATIRDDGVIGITYFDFRSNTAEPGTLWTTYWLATSTDGTAWTETAIAPPFNYATAPVVGGSFFLGDYMSLASAGTSFVPFFAQTTGDVGNRSDIFARLARANTATANAGVMVRSVEAPPWPVTTDSAQRIDANARRVLAQRIPPGPLPERPPEP